MAASTSAAMRSRTWLSPRLAGPGPACGAISFPKSPTMVLRLSARKSGGVIVKSSGRCAAQTLRAGPGNCSNPPGFASPKPAARAESCSLTGVQVQRRPGHDLATRPPSGAGAEVGPLALAAEDHQQLGGLVVGV